jgi:hypothetical protein
VGCPPENWSDCSQRLVLDDAITAARRSGRDHWTPMMSLSSTSEVPKATDVNDNFEAMVAKAEAGEITPSELADAWLAYHRGSRSEDDPNWWAVEVLFPHDVWWDDEVRVRETLLALVGAAESESEYGMIGAGPMEDFINSDEDRLGWLEEHANASADFRRAMANVYVWGVESDAIAARLERMAKTRLPRPKGWVDCDHPTP